MITVKKNRVPTYIISLLSLLSLTEMLPIAGHRFFYPIAIMLVKNTTIVKLWFSVSYIISRLFMLTILIPTILAVPMSNVYVVVLTISLFILTFIEYHYDTKLWVSLLGKYKTNISRVNYFKLCIKYSVKVALIGGILLELSAFMILSSIIEIVPPLYWRYGIYLFIGLILIIVYPITFLFSFEIAFFEMCVVGVIILPYVTRVMAGVSQFQKDQALPFNGVE